MTGRLYAQLAHVVWRDAEAAEDEREHRRLRSMAQTLHRKASDLGVTNTGTDAVFGEEETTGEEEGVGRQ